MGCDKEEQMEKRLRLLALADMWVERNITNQGAIESTKL